MIRTSIAASIALGVLLSASSANAVTIYKASLSGDQKSTPTGSLATGNGMVTISGDLNFADVDLRWEGLSLPAAAGHIHCCAAPGFNGPVALDLGPVAQISGMVTGTFDLNDAGSYSGGFLALFGGDVASAKAGFLAGLSGGQAYFNLHNTNFPAGEIRGNISAIPEPASWALMIAGFGFVGGALRHRRQGLATA